MELSKMTEILPLNKQTCMELLKRSGEDVSDVTVLSHKIDINGTVRSGLSSSRDILRILIHYERDLEMQHKTMLMKAPLMSPYYHVLHQFGVYDKEYLLYSRVIPEMRKLDGDSFTPEFYMGNCDLPVIIMEDLYSLGYEHANVITRELYRKGFKGHQMVFKYLAKFHVLSLKLDQMGLIPDKIKEGIDESRIMGENTRSYYTRGISNFIEYLDPKLRSRYSVKLEYLKDNIYDRIVEESQLGIRTLIHGNLWLANILTKQDETGSVEKIAFINFENCKWSNPLFDILHFSLTTLRCSEITWDIEYYLETYVEAMEEISKLCDMPVPELKTTSNDVLKCYGYVMWVCGIMSPVLVNNDTPIDLDKFKYLLKDRAWYTETINDWFRYFVKKGIFDD